jgi:hypothetical protein
MKLKVASVKVERCRQDSEDRANKTFNYHNSGLYTGCAGLRPLDGLQEQSRPKTVEGKSSESLGLSGQLTLESL